MTDLERSRKWCDCDLLIPTLFKPLQIQETFTQKLKQRQRQQRKIKCL